MTTADEGLSRAAPVVKISRRGREIIYRQRLPVRLTHWINVFAMTILLMSGLQIFNAHPSLYWGQQGNEGDPALLSIHSVQSPNNGPLNGVVDLGRRITLPTTGVLGVSNMGGHPTERAWPAWVTIPGNQDLATGRHWHFFFAWLFLLNGVVYLVWSLVTRHLQRDLTPNPTELRRVWPSILHHLRLQYPRGQAAKRYDVLQKLAYLPVVVVLLPLMVLTGLTMSPGIDAAAPWLLDLFGGRQSARSIHFITASLLVLFVLVHVSQVILAGFFNEMRSMITGRFEVPPDRPARSGDANHGR